MLLPVGNNRFISYATRDDWGAHRHRLKPAKLYTPVNWVRFTFTESPPCQDPATCGKMVRAIQELYLDNGAWDIPHNFLVGGDGVLYEGRGWAYQPDVPEEFQHLREDCVDIAYIGDFTEEDPSCQMRETALNFVMYQAIKMRHISPTFRVVPYRKIQKSEEEIKVPSDIQGNSKEEIESPSPV